MANIEKLAFEAHKESRLLNSCQQTPDHFWSDWFCKGYKQAEKDLQAKAIAAFDEMWLAEDDFESDYEYHRKKFIEKLNSQTKYHYGKKRKESNYHGRKP